MSDNINMIDRDELTEIARKAECLDRIMGDLLHNFFASHDPDKEDTAGILIAHDFKHYRLYAELCYDFAHRIKEELHSHGIECYTPCIGDTQTFALI